METKHGQRVDMNTKDLSAAKKRHIRELTLSEATLRKARIDVIGMQIGEKLECMQDGEVTRDGMSFTDAVATTLRDLEVLEVTDYEALVADAARYMILARALYDPSLETSWWSMGQGSAA